MGTPLGAQWVSSGDRIDTGPVLIVLRRLLIATYGHQVGLPKVLRSTKGSKELTDGSNVVQQQGFAIVSMTRQARNSDPAAPTVVQDAILLDPLVWSAKPGPNKYTNN